MEKETKQVIVIRKDLKNKDGNKVRTGKLIAQGAHASMKAILEYGDWVDSDCYELMGMPSPMVEWLKGRFTKVCVSCDSELELLELYKQALNEDIPCSLITDAGLTEFNGVPTKTCIAIGPYYPDEINKITGHLKLL